MANRTDPAVIRDWLKVLGSLTASNASSAEANGKLSAYVPWLAADYDPQFFTPRSLKWAAERFKFFPSYAELTAFFGEHRALVGVPQPVAAIGYDVPERPSPPDAEALVAVASVVQAFTAGRSWNQSRDLPGSLGAVKPGHLSDGALLAAWQDAERQGVGGAAQRVAMLRAKMAAQTKIHA